MAINRRYLLSLGALVALAGAIPSCAVGALAPTQAPAAGQQSKAGGYTKVSPAELTAMLAKKDFPLINVHVPYEGEIEGTDAFVAYDKIGANLDKLPADKGARIVLYCRRGSMSTTAAGTSAQEAWACSRTRTTAGSISAHIAHKSMIARPLP